MYHIYVLQSQTDGSYYIGMTGDIEKRMREHNFGRTGYASLKRPWKLVYAEQYETRSEARKRELYLKSLKNKKYLERIIHQGL